MSQTHILIIEDDDPYRIMLGSALEANGYRVTLAENGRVGMTLFREDPADLVLTDVVMPEQEGIETIIDLKKGYPELKVIAMSGDGAHSETYLRLCSKLGAEATLSKPFSLDTLNSMIEKELGSGADNTA